MCMYISRLLSSRLVDVRHAVARLERDARGAVADVELLLREVSLLLVRLLHHLRRQVHVHARSQVVRSSAIEPLAASHGSSSA